MYTEPVVIQICVQMMSPFMPQREPSYLCTLPLHKQFPLFAIPIAQMQGTNLRGMHTSLKEDPRGEPS